MDPPKERLTAASTDPSLGLVIRSDKLITYTHTHNDYVCLFLNITMLFPGKLPDGFKIFCNEFPGAIGIKEPFYCMNCGNM